VGNAKHQLTLSNLGAERDGVLLLGGFNFFRWLPMNIIQKSALQSSVYEQIFEQKTRYIVVKHRMRCPEVVLLTIVTIF